MKLKTLALTAAAATAIAGASAAQDAANTWTGFYAGVNIGGAWNTSCASISLNDTVNNTSDTIASNCAHPGHFIGGGQIGYNYEFSNIVLGLEAGISGGTQSSQTYTAFTLGNPDHNIPAGTYQLTGTHTPGAIGEIRARVGYDFGGKALVYFTGGGIFASSGGNATLTYISPDLHTTASFSGTGQSGTRTGWMLGGGLEYKLTPNWSIKGEDVFANTGNISNPTVCVDNISGAFCHTFNTGVVQIKSAGNAGNVNIFRVGVNYKFF